MDAVLIPRATETQQIMRMKTAKKNGRGNFVSNNLNHHSENFDTCAGALNPPPSRAMSFSYSHYVQPPLLPLPHASSRSLLTAKKSKPTKREEAKKRSGTQSILITRRGPEPKDLPKVIRNNNIVIHDDEDVVSGFIFNLAPPPSSLPLPKFSMRSKLRCNAEAAAAGGAVDDGATNNLRRLLRLR